MPVTGLVERKSHGTFEGKGAGAGEVKWGVWGIKKDQGVEVEN
jgi:hypothetical protein